MALPPSVIQDQVSHIRDNKKPNLIAASVVCLTAAYTAVALRFAARRVARNKLGADDYMILVALLFTTTFNLVVLLATHYGLGQHSILVTNGAAFGKTVLAGEILYNPAIFSTKVSILLLYGRLFPVRKFVLALYAVGAFVAAYSLTAALVNLLQCLPVNADWNPSIKPHCVNLDVELIIVSSINVVTDFVILCLPMPLVWRLHTSKSRKLQVTGMFLLGGFVCTVSIVRATFVSQVSLLDGSWVDADGAIWSIVETGIAVVSACLPALKPLLRKTKSKQNKNTPISIGDKTFTAASSTRRIRSEQTVETDEVGLV